MLHDLNQTLFQKNAKKDHDQYRGAAQHINKPYALLYSNLALSPFVSPCVLQFHKHLSNGYTDYVPRRETSNTSYLIALFDANAEIQELLSNPILTDLALVHNGALDL